MTRRFNIVTTRYKIVPSTGLGIIPKKIPISFTASLRTMLRQTVLAEKRADQDPCFLFEIFEFDNLIRKKKTASELCQLR